MSEIPEPAQNHDLGGLRHTSLWHLHLYRPHWVLQWVGLDECFRAVRFFRSVSFCFIDLTFFPFRFKQRPSREENGHSSNRNQPAMKLPTVTTDLGTKLGTRLSNGVAIHHCRDGLLPLPVAIPSSLTPAICSLPTWPESAGTRFRGLPLSASEPSSSRSKCRFNAVRIRLAASVLGDIGRTYLNIGRKRRKVLWVFTHSRANRSEYGSTNEAAAESKTGLAVVITISRTSRAYVAIAS